MDHGIVKSVLSGDTLVIRGRPINGPPPELLVGLAWVQAPRFNKNENESQAFEAREFLRKLLVAKTVQFKIEYKNQKGKAYASIFYSDASGTLLNISLEVLKEGFGKYRGDDPIYSDIEFQAKTSQLGIWAVDNGRLLSFKSTIENLNSYVDTHKGLLREAIIEQVKDASFFRVLFLEDLQYASCILAGVKCPTFRKGVPGVNDLIEPFADEAKYFVETRLLQREVKVLIKGSSNQNLIVDLIHPAGNITELLLLNGFAKIVNFAAEYITENIAIYRKAENVAKLKKLRIWKFSNDDPNSNSGEIFEGSVLKIISGDCLLIETEDGYSRKIYLSNIRQPHFTQEQALNFKAREFLRKKLIGKNVMIEVDFIKPATETSEECCCATVLYGKNRNAAEDLLLQGLAYIATPKNGDHSSSKYFDRLVAAVSKGRESKLGIFGLESSEKIRISDASENVAKARSFLPFFKRAGRITATVEHVFSGNKFKLFIPKDSCNLIFALTGVKCPRVKGETELEAYGLASLKFSERRCLQRDVEIEIEGIDKFGGFIGTLWLNKKIFAVDLLSSGLATIFSVAAENSRYANELYMAENEAKSFSRNIWSIVHDGEPADNDVSEISNEIRNVIVTHVIDGTSAYVRFLGSENERLIELNKDLEFTIKSEISKTVVKPKNGDFVAAKSLFDNHWYRGKILKGKNSTEYEVQYCDFGRCETINIERIHSLEPRFLKLKIQATLVCLSYCKSPRLDQDYGSEAKEIFESLAMSKFLCRIDYKDNNILYVTLYDTKEVKEVSSKLVQLSINGKLLRSGYAQVDVKTRSNSVEVLGLLKEQERYARLNRLGMFEYGDYDLED